jgi:hypothetical protein
MSYSFLFAVLSECQGDVSSSRQAFMEVAGNCYSGEVEFQHLTKGITTLNDIPSLVRTFQSQQNDLSYLCKSSNIPPKSAFHGPIKELNKARDFVIAEITSDAIAARMTKLKDKHPWLDSLDKRDSGVYFELVGNVSSLFPNVMFMASRSYAEGGLVIVTLYFEGVLYVTVEDTAGCDQPLLDINFPKISASCSRGATLAMYDNDDDPWMKLSVWQSMQGTTVIQPQQTGHATVPAVKDLSSDAYVQSYVVLKSQSNDEIRDVLFRFGSWLYTGKVKLVPKLITTDIPFVMPAIRLQQNNLDFLGDVDSLDTSNPFVPVLELAMKTHAQMEGLAAESEDSLRSLMENGESWLVEDNNDSFFEFSCFNDGNSTLTNIELIATKSYSAGVVTTSIYFGGNWYLVVNEGNDESKLVDSKFPSISTVEASGYNIQSYPSGNSGWPQLRSLTIWHSHRVIDDTPGDECDVVSPVEDESVVIQSEQESDVTRSRRWRDPWDKTVERGEIAVPIQNVKEKNLDTLVPKEIIDVGDPVQKDDGYDVVDECTIPDGGGDDINIADQLEISRLEESLENIGPDDDDSSDIGDTVNIGDVTLDLSREETKNNVVVEVCADTDDLYMQMEKLDRNLDRALQDLKEWEK